MSQYTFIININEFILKAATQRAQRENITSLVATLISRYAQGYTPAPQPLLNETTISHTVTVDLAEETLRTVSTRLQHENHTAEQLIADLLTDYAQTDPTLPDHDAAPPTPEIVTPPAAAPIPGVSYGTIPIVGQPTDRPAEQHGDINLALRGYAPTPATLDLIDMNGPTDSRAPQLNELFADKRTPRLVATYRVHQWHWASPPNPGTRGPVITDFEATCIGLATTQGETLHVPGAGYEIGRGYQVMVLYASTERITLTYTGEDNVIHGYSLHLEGVQVEPSLLALYQQMNEQGRRELPGLAARQALGRAQGSEVKVCIRDTGRFMDPRVRKDWWRGR